MMAMGLHILSWEKANITKSCIPILNNLRFVNFCIKSYVLNRCTVLVNSIPIYKQSLYTLINSIVSFALNTWTIEMSLMHLLVKKHFS